MKETANKISKDVDVRDLPLSKLPSIVKEAKQNENQIQSEEIEHDTEEKLYLLGFMPLGEINSLVLNELGESYNLQRVKKLWIPKSQKMNQLVASDTRLLDEEKMRQVVNDIDPKHSKKIKEIEDKLVLNPFWRANKPSIKMVKIDELIALQSSINIDRANFLAKHISKNATIQQLLDYTFDFNRKSSVVSHHMISPNSILFSTKDHDVRPGKIEVRRVNRYYENNENDSTVPALTIPIVTGEPFVYCVRTFSIIPNQDGTTKKIYFITLQNGIHRAYALRSLGIEYMPCLIIDPVTSGETNLLMSNWSPERMQQNATQRPPLMKDFFNSDLTEKFNVPKRQMCVKVEWKIEKFTV